MLVVGKKGFPRKVTYKLGLEKRGLFLDSLKKELLPVFWVPGNLLGAGDSVVSKESPPYFHSNRKTQRFIN